MITDGARYTHTHTVAHTLSMRAPSDQLDWTVCINSLSILIIKTATSTKRPNIILNVIEQQSDARRREKMSRNWLTDWLAGWPTDWVNEWKADGPATKKNYTTSICFINEKKVATQMPAAQFDWKWWLDKLFFHTKFPFFPLQRRPVLLFLHTYSCIAFLLSIRTYILLKYILHIFILTIDRTYFL